MVPIRFVRCAALAGAIAAIGLTGCGRKGALEPPPGASVIATQPREQARGVEGSQNDALEVNPSVKNTAPPRGAFILDPLL